MSIWTKPFWQAAGERAAKSAAQAAILQLAIGEGFNAFDADWATAGGFALGGAALSVLTSVASAGIGDTSGPSLGGGEVLSSKAIPAEVVDAIADPDSPSGSVAGPASSLPDETPVDVVPVDPHIAVQDSDRGLPSDPLDAPSQDYDGYGAPISDKP